MCQVCFRLPGPDAAAPDPVRPGPTPPLHLSTRAAEGLAELLQVFACGEESAALAFRHLADARAEAAVGEALALIAGEETVHEQLLRGLRAALPDPVPDPALLPVLRRFYLGLGRAEAGRHLAAIAALDSAVCGIVGATLRAPAPLAREPAVHAVFARIQREEAGHVRLSRHLARELAGRAAAAEVAAQTRQDLVAVLGLRGAAFDALGVDPDALFARLRRPPAGLFA